MKIDLSGSSPDPVITSRASDPNAAPTNSVHNAEDDKTTLSYDRANIDALTSQAMSTADVRHDKIDALRQVISSGQYKIEPDKIAERMLHDSPKPSSTL